MAIKFRLLAVLATLSFAAYAEEAAPAEEQESAEAKADREAMQAEVAYVGALIDSGYPDLAEPVIAATKKRWPQSEASFFALEVRGLLNMGKFKEAENVIASLPDRKSGKYWAARLEVANSYFQRNKKEDCMKIYDEFFAAFPKAPKGLEDFYKNAGYAYGQLLSQSKQYDKASQVYGRILPTLTGASWTQLATEYADLLMRVAEENDDPKQKAKRDQALAEATKVVEKLLNQSTDNAVLFGRAIGMKAHLEQLKGNVRRASMIIEEYKPDLMDIDDQINQADPEGRRGLKKISPLPEVMYIQAKMLWDEAQKEYNKKPKRDDEAVKAYMFGEKGDNGKRDGIGAFNIALSIYTNFEMSPWAPLAGELAEEVRKFAEEKYQAKIKTTITPEQIARVRAAQFKLANDNFNSDEFAEAVKNYLDVLAKYPEIEQSVPAVQNLAASYLNLMNEAQAKNEKEEYRDSADAVEGYLGERFAGNRDKVIMTTAGNAVLGLAAREKEMGDLVRADRLYTQFVRNYRRHAQAANLCAGKGAEFIKAGDLENGMRYWGYIAEYYTNSQYYAESVRQLAMANDKLGHRDEAKRLYREYLPLETKAMMRAVAQMQLSQMFKDDGVEMIKNAATNTAEGAESVDEALVKKGMVQIVNAVKQFTDLAKVAEEGAKDTRLSESDRKTLDDIREGSLFLAAQCRGRLGQSLKQIGREDQGKTFMGGAATAYDAYLSAYPKGKFAKNAYMQLSTIYTALGDLAKSKEALDRLSQAYPDSDEAKNAKPSLAKALIEMGMANEGTQIYAEMLRTDGAYTPQQFVAAGDALIDARKWDLANQAFEKAVRLAGTNFPQTVAKAQIGKARSAFRQNSFAEARDALDMFLQDTKMSKLQIAADANFLLVEVAKAQGRTEKDADMRTKYFNAAIGALKKVRGYWKNKPAAEQNQLDLLSGEVLIDRMKAEDAMGLKEDAFDTCGRAAATFQVFIQAHGPSAEVPIDKMSEGDRENLERAYANVIPLFARQEGEIKDDKERSEKAQQVIKFGEEYQKYFPAGKHLTAVQNAMNSAKADVKSAPAAQ